MTDAAAVLEAIAGHDPKDSTSIPQPVPASSTVSTTASRDCGSAASPTCRAGADPDVEERLEVAFDALVTAGATVVDVQVPAFTYGLTAYYLIAPAEASSNLARYDGVRYGLRVEAPDTNAMYGVTRPPASATR